MESIAVLYKELFAAVFTFSVKNMQNQHCELILKVNVDVSTLGPAVSPPACDGKVFLEWRCGSTEPVDPLRGPSEGAAAGYLHRARVLGVGACERLGPFGRTLVKPCGEASSGDPSHGARMSE